MILEIKLSDCSGVSDGWTDDHPSYLGCDGGTGNIVSLETTKVSAGSTSIKSVTGTNGNTTELILSFPRHNYDYLPFDQILEEQVSFDLYYYCQGAQAAYYLYMVLEDDVGHKIRWNGLTFDFPRVDGVGGWYKGTLTSTDLEKWRTCSVKVGSEVEIQPYDSSLGWWDTWRYTTNTGIFNWRVVKMTIGSYIGGAVPTNYIIVDNLNIPIPMVGFAENTTSQEIMALENTPRTIVVFILRERLTN
jgi:hypothetical protein